MCFTKDKVTAEGHRPRQPALTVCVELHIWLDDERKVKFG